MPFLGRYRQITALIYLTMIRGPRSKKRSEFLGQTRTIGRNRFIATKSQPLHDLNLAQDLLCLCHMSPLQGGTAPQVRRGLPADY